MFRKFYNELIAWLITFSFGFVIIGCVATVVGWVGYKFIDFPGKLDSVWLDGLELGINIIKYSVPISIVLFVIGCFTYKGNK